MIVRTRQINKHPFQILAWGFCSVALLLTASCGSEQPKSPENQLHSEFGLLESNAHDKRFSNAEIADVYTNEVKNGTPVNKPFLIDLYNDTSQAPDLADELGDFTNAGEIKAYLNLARDPGPLTRTRFVLALEGVSLWTRILNDKGQPLFKETFSIDANGQKINDAIDGKLPNGEQLQYVRLKMQVSIASVNADMSVRIVDHGDHLSVRMTNVRDIKAPVVGTVIKTGKFNINLELYPYEQGYLTYGATAAKLEQFGDKLSPEMLATQVSSILNWMHTKLLGK